MDILVWILPGIAARWNELGIGGLYGGKGKAAARDALDGHSIAGKRSRVRDRRATGDVDEDVVESGVDIDGKAAMHDQLPGEVGTPCKADARLDVLEEGVDFGESRRRKRQAGVPERIWPGLLLHAFVVEKVDALREELIAQPEVECEVRRDLPVVLEIEGVSPVR